MATGNEDQQASGAEERRYSDTENAMTVAFAPYDPRVPDDVKTTLENMSDTFGNASALGAAAALVRDTRTDRTERKVNER